MFTILKGVHYTFKGTIKTIDVVTNFFANMTRLIDKR